MFFLIFCRFFGLLLLLPLFHLNPQTDYTTTFSSTQTDTTVKNIFPCPSTDVAGDSAQEHQAQIIRPTNPPGGGGGGHDTDAPENIEAYGTGTRCRPRCARSG